MITNAHLVSVLLISPLTFPLWEQAQYPTRSQLSVVVSLHLRKIFVVGDYLSYFPFAMIQQNPTTGSDWSELVHSLVKHTGVPHDKTNLKHKALGFSNSVMIKATSTTLEKNFAMMALLMLHRRMFFLLSILILNRYRY